LRFSLDCVFRFVSEFILNRQYYMENTLKVYLDSVTSFNSFLELDSTLENKHTVAKLQQIYPLKETRITLNGLMKKLINKYN